MAAILFTRAQKDGILAPDRIEQFFTTMETVALGAKTVSRKLAYELAEDFNVLDYMRTDELGLSELICNLLNPQGTHGQGDCFLRLFLHECQFDLGEYVKIEDAAVRTEVPVFMGRLDIQIQFGSGFGLVIENKPFASDQEDQLNRYTDYLEQTFGSNGYLVYMPGFKLSSETMSEKNILQLTEPKRRYSVLPYNAVKNGPSVKRWLTSCFREANAPKMRYFLSDFSRWTDRSFPLLENETKEQRS